MLSILLFLWSSVSRAEICDSTQATLPNSYSANYESSQYHMDNHYSHSDPGIPSPDNSSPENMLESDSNEGSPSTTPVPTQGHGQVGTTRSTSPLTDNGQDDIDKTKDIKSKLILFLYLFTDWKQNVLITICWGCFSNVYDNTNEYMQDVEVRDHAPVSTCVVGRDMSVSALYLDVGLGGEGGGGFRVSLFESLSTTRKTIVIPLLHKLM